MARSGKSSFSHIFTGVLLATVILPEFLLAVPVTRRFKEDGTERADAAATSRRLVRNRRNISWYKQHSDFWNWYKLFSDSGNQDGVAQLDRVYLAYLQNKNRAEAQSSYKLYLQHLGEIYKSCAETDDPNCVASYTSRQKASTEPPKPAAVRSCDPYRDPYCLQSRGYALYPYMVPSSVRSPAPAPAPAPVKTPAYIQAPSSGYQYYAPMAQSFLSSEQKAELLHICGPDDVECLQYHLRGAYGHKPAGAPAPSYAHLGCDPKSDPYCKPQQAQKTPVGMYLRYPNCDPRVDPYCAYSLSQRAEAPSAPLSSDRMCNPLIDENCNPLTATRFASFASSSKDPNDDPTSGQPSHRYDPYSMYQNAAASRSPSTPQLPQYLQPPSMEENSHPYGPPGKTKEGYDCFIGYDAECYPVGSHNMPSSAPSRHVPHPAEAYVPHLNDPGTRTGVIEPDPDCDPEYDRNCRLRRYEPEAERSELPAPHKEQEREHREEPQDREDHQENQGYDQQYDRYMSGQEDPYATYGPPDQSAVSFQDMLRAFGGRVPGQDDYRGYTGDYKKK
ncbi:actinodin1 [Trichomycterus rosablanca]|uniref:actinodin1 n=1 Tax=Trichomycterus rosablanca TaxID=2290929 RepID=UPI002F350413